MAKGKRWAKGQSSSSNPSSHKYRDIAKSNRSFFTFGLPTASEEKNTSQLTRKALAELDSKSVGNEHFETRSEIAESEYSAADSFRSWATNWSDCTNATFNKVHKYWRSNSAFHKEILAVLAAITEVIKENDGKESETEYLAALMTGLESVKSNQESCAAFLYLIALAIKKVPENVLRAKYSDLIKTLTEQLDQYSNSSNNVTLVKSCLKCLCWILKSLGRQEWQNDLTVKCFIKILEHVQDDKPKIRKCGQEAVRLVLNSCASSIDADAKLTYELITSLTADYGLDLIMNDEKEESEDTDSNNNQKNNKDLKKNNLKTKNQRILYALTLFKHVVHHFSTKKLKTIGECLLRLMTLKDIIITSNCFQIFNELFNSQNNFLNPQLNAQIINALYDYQPSENDPQQLIGWLAVMESAIRCLNRLDKNLCLSHLPHFYQIAMQSLISHHKNVQIMATNCMTTILEQCVQTNINLFIDDIKQSIDIKKSLLHKIFSCIENGLGYQYHMSWIFVMKILACAFTCFKSSETFVVVEKCLSSLGNLRESEQFTYKKEADLAIGRAIQTYGPKLMLECIPLNITGNETNYDYSRSWVLPLLKDFIEKTELSFFANTLLPLATKLRTKSKMFLDNKMLIEHKIFDTLQNQIWALLPGFCDFPTDFSESFKSMARCLGESLEKHHDIRPYILHGLRRLIHRNTDENKLLMSKYAKNYLPIMFNIYTTELRSEKDPIRQSLIDTIKFFLYITDSELINTYLIHAVKNYESNCKLHDEALKKSSQTDNSTNKVKFDFDKMPSDDKKKSETSNNTTLDHFLFAKYSFLDLISILAKYSNEKNVTVVYDLVISGIESKELDKTIQKKSYKILDSILTSGKQKQDKPHYKQNLAINQFIKSKFEMVSNKFVKSLSECNVAAKVPRLKCLLDLMDYINDPAQKIFLRQILPEVILCIREINHKSREASFLLLNSMLRCWQNLGLLSNIAENESLNEFMHLVMVGLAGSNNMVSCTCLALASLSYEFKENISGSLINDLIETACLLTRSDQKEIVISSLNLLKILITIFNQVMLAPYLDKICESIHALHEKRQSSNSNQVVNTEQSFNNLPPVSKSSQIRQFVKIILKKLIKKFSYEILFEKIFKNELVNSHKTQSTVDAMDSGVSVEENKKLLTGVIKQGLENLLVNIKKKIEKEKKRKEEQEKSEKNKSSNQQVDLISMYTSKTQQTIKTNYNEVEDLLKESDSEDEAEEDMKSKKTSKTNKKDEKSRRSKKNSEKQAMAWLQENENDDPLDLLDPMAIKRVMATKPLSKEEIERKKQKELNSKSKNRGFSIDRNSGKLVIQDDEDEEDSDDQDDKKSRKSKKSLKNKSGDIDEMMDTLSISKKSQLSRKTKKRAIDTDSDDSDDDVKDTKSKFSYKPGGSGIHRKLDGRKEISVGKEYRAKKATGDVKIKNKHDPYAYLPFNSAKLNKRKRAKLQGEYKGIVKAVKKGAANGKKIKRL